MRKCPHCGEALATAKRKPTKRARAITLGRGPSKGFNQGEEYRVAMAVKAGHLVWSMLKNADRFGARGGFVSPEEAVRLEGATLAAAA